MDSHFGFDFKTLREYRIGFGEGERERAVACHDVGDIRAKQSIDGIAYQTIAEVMEWPLVLLEVGGAQTVANHHVVPLEHLIYQGRCRVGRVSVVAVRHDIYVGVDVFEHGSNHIAFTLARLFSNDCSLGRGDFGGAIGGIVVIDVNISVGQRAFKIAYYLADSDFFVVTRQEYGDGSGSMRFLHGITIPPWVFGRRPKAVQQFVNYTKLNHAEISHQSEVGIAETTVCRKNRSTSDTARSATVILSA